jgi:hypothetical protein
LLSFGLFFYFTIEKKFSTSLDPWFFYFTTVKKEEATEEDCNSLATDLWNQFAKILPYMTGGFDFDGETSTTRTVGQVVLVFIITILMLNLLVGVLSEKLGEIVSKKTISSYKLLLQICIEAETLASLFKCGADVTDGVHLVYATRIEPKEEWEG